MDALVVMHAPRPFRLAIANPLIVVGTQQVGTHKHPAWLKFTPF
jgi:hypothetical protein